MTVVLWPDETRRLKILRFGESFPWEEVLSRATIYIYTSGKFLS